MRSPFDLAEHVRDARRRTLDVVAGLDDGQLMGPRLGIVNPLRWEIGHVAWFQEKWVLRHALGCPPLRGDGDALWDSTAIPHDTRWDLPLPTLEGTLAYMREVESRVLEVLARAADAEVLYHVGYAIGHEDMHDEAFTYTRQTLAYPPPRFQDAAPEPAGDGGGPWPGDVDIPGGRFLLGALGDEPFV